MLEGDLDAAEQARDRSPDPRHGGRLPDDAAIDLRRPALRPALDARPAAEMVPLIEQVAHDNPGLQIFRAALAFAKSFDDAHDEVRQLLDTEVTNDFPMFADATWLAAQVLWAMPSRAVGIDRPRRSCTNACCRGTTSSRRPTSRSTGAVAHYLGLLAHTLDRHDEADRWFGQALALHEAMEAPFFVALTQTAWAELLADREQARRCAPGASPSGGGSPCRHCARVRRCRTRRACCARADRTMSPALRTRTSFLPGADDEQFELDVVQGRERQALTQTIGSRRSPSASDRVMRSAALHTRPSARPSSPAPRGRRRTEQ